MLVAVIGGNLQGVEATYLAKKAGWEVLVIDQKPVVPAKGLCDRFKQLDVTAEKNLSSAFKGVDLVIPALENDAALACLNQWTQNTCTPFAFDLEAYSMTSSKRKSDPLFSRIDVPTPLPWPKCGFPVVAKPSVGSGSQGVKVYHDSESFHAHVNESDDNWVLQQYVHGPSYSIEVIGYPGHYTPLQVTDLEMDADYDCKRVLAPTDLFQNLISDFEQISISLANELQLKGLMDIEIILHDHKLKVLEIDARLPSQTPTAAYWSTGLNMVQMLGNLFLSQGEINLESMQSPKSVIYEHIQKMPNLLEVAGEHIMSGVDPLYIQQNFFGADEAITNFAPNRDEWVATLIVVEENRKAVWEKRNTVIADIQQHFNIEIYRDASPMGGNTLQKNLLGNLS
ncbi:MAG: 3-methylornithine--L-lysine ligase PylC [Desulfobacterales bacterium]|nr:MAG: 3-methylornithine--L-lysine ligase PylC [Desulfobacterales bacterium]